MDTIPETSPIHPSGKQFSAELSSGSRLKAPSFELAKSGSFACDSCIPALHFATFRPKLPILSQLFKLHDGKRTKVRPFIGRMERAKEIIEVPPLSFWWGGSSLDKHRACEFCSLLQQDRIAL